MSGFQNGENGQMSQAGSRCPVATRFIRKLRGGSQPILIEASDGAYYVLKFRNNPQGENVLFNESAGTELFHACGLPVAPWKPIFVSARFLDRNSGCWVETPDGMLRPEPGLSFGSAFLGSTGQLLEILPRGRFSRIRERSVFWLAWLVDICCMHADNRQAVFQLESDGTLSASFVDMGHLFGGPKGNLQPHYLASRYLDPDIYADVTSKEVTGILQVVRMLDTVEFRNRLKAIPDEWQETSITRRIEQSLSRLSNMATTLEIFEAMLGKRQVSRERGPDAIGVAEAEQRTILHDRFHSDPDRDAALLERRPALDACG